MAPAHSSAHHPHIDQNLITRPDVHEQDADSNVSSELFIDPMLGTPLAMYIEKDVEAKDILAGLVTVSRVAVSREKKDVRIYSRPSFRRGIVNFFHPCSPTLGVVFILFTLLNLRNTEGQYLQDTVVSPIFSVCRLFYEQ
jgi:hypothetical protein